MKDIRAGVDIMNADGIEVLTHGEVAHTIDQMGEWIELGKHLHQMGEGINRIEGVAGEEQRQREQSDHRLQPLRGVHAHGYGRGEEEKSYGEYTHEEQDADDCSGGLKSRVAGKEAYPYQQSKAHNHHHLDEGFGDSGEANSQDDVVSGHGAG